MEVSKYPARQKPCRPRRIRCDLLDIDWGGVFCFLAWRFPLLGVHLLSKNNRHGSFVSSPPTCLHLHKNLLRAATRCGTRRTSSACRRSTPPTVSRYCKKSKSLEKAQSNWEGRSVCSLKAQDVSPANGVFCCGHTERCCNAGYQKLRERLLGGATLFLSARRTPFKT